MRRVHTCADLRLWIYIALTLVVGACIQPNEQSDGELGTFIGNAVGEGEGDAGANGAGEGNGGSNATGGASTGSDDTTATNGADPAANGGATTSGAQGASGGADPGSQGTTGAPPQDGEADAGTTAVDAGGTPPPAAPALTSLTFSVLTKPIGGNYAPKNIGAIWVTNESGVFVKTLKQWASQRLQYLTTFKAQTDRNKVDAVTTATLSSHVVHTVTWNLKKLSGQIVPDGKYNIVIETTDRNTFGDSIAVPFVIGPSPGQSKPADTTHYVNMSITLK